MQVKRIQQEKKNTKNKKREKDLDLILRHVEISYLDFTPTITDLINSYVYKNLAKL